MALLNFAMGFPRLSAGVFIRTTRLFFFMLKIYRKVPEIMNPAISNSQLSLDFTPGLTERYPTVLDCIASSVHTNHKPLKTIAADMDMSQSDLSRKLANNADDTRRFSVLDLEAYVKATGDTTPILYLAQKYCADRKFAQQEALTALANMAPQLQALLKAAGVA